MGNTSFMLSRRDTFLSFFLLMSIHFTPGTIYSQNLLNAPESVVFDSLFHRYLVSNWNNGDIIQIDLNEQQSYFSTVLSRVAGIHIHDTILYATSNLGNYKGIVGFALATGDTLFRIQVPGMQLLNDITSDTSGNLYVTEYNLNKIFKIRMATGFVTTFVDDGLSMPNGILFDEVNNRLLVVNEGMSGGPIMGVSLQDSSMTTLVYTSLSFTDGISRDRDRNVYVSSWGTGCVYRYDPSFSQPKEKVSCGHFGPADISVNTKEDILAVPNFQRNSVDFVPIFPLHEMPLGKEVLSGKPVCHPNPFSQNIFLSFELSEPAFVECSIYAMDGLFMTSLAKTYLAAGNHRLIWQADDQNGNHSVPGIYLVRFCSGGNQTVEKIVLIP